MKNSLKPMRQVLNGLLAAASVGAVSLILINLRELLSPAVVALLYLVPVLASSALWGRLGGLVASTLSFLVFNYFFVPPYYTLRVAHPQDFLAIFVFLGVGMLISGLMASAQARLAQVQRREREAHQLYQFSMDLTAKTDAAVIAATLADYVLELLQPARVEVEVHSGDKTLRMCSPESSSQPLEKPAGRIPLPGARGLHGSIRVFRHQALTLEEERWMQTIASQGALALERSFLTESETRAHILEEANRLKSAILSSVSHELRTPLAAIQASATSLFDPQVELSPEARQELQTLLLEESENMTQLVGNLLNMSRIEAGALKVKVQWNSLAEIVDSAMRRLRKMSVGHIIESGVSDDLPLVPADAVLMEQVFINLVGNSLKFAPQHTLIRIDAGVEGQSLLVTVSNQGPHIPDGYIEHVFKKFYPIPGTETSRGTGLGLSICQGIVEAHGGRIWAENLALGVAFKFTLPLTLDGALPLLPEQESEGG